MRSDQEIIKVLLNQESINIVDSLEIGMSKDTAVSNSCDNNPIIKHFYAFPSMRNPGINAQFIEVVFDDETSIFIPMNAILAIICKPDNINCPAN